MMVHKMVLLLTVVAVCGGAGASPRSRRRRISATRPNWWRAGTTISPCNSIEKLQGEKGNLFFSPYSISTALAMTYAGAKGRTQEQMAQVLCFPTLKEVVQKLAESREPLTPESFARAFGEIVRDLNQRGGRGTYELRVANALWGQQDSKFLASFTKLVESQYGGHLEQGQLRLGRREGPADDQCLGREADQRQDQGPHRPGRARQPDPAGSDQRGLLQGQLGHASSRRIGPRTSRSRCSTAARSRSP